MIMFRGVQFSRIDTGHEISRKLGDAKISQSRVPKRRLTLGLTYVLQKKQKSISVPEKDWTTFIRAQIRC